MQEEKTAITADELSNMEVVAPSPFLVLSKINQNGALSRGTWLLGFGRRHGESLEERVPNSFNHFQRRFRGVLAAAQHQENRGKRGRDTTDPDCLFKNRVQGLRCEYENLAMKKDRWLISQDSPS